MDKKKHQRRTAETERDLGRSSLPGRPSPDEGEEEFVCPLHGGSCPLKIKPSYKKPQKGIDLPTDFW